MSKQHEANAIYNKLVVSEPNMSRKTIILQIIKAVDCSPAYAATLYNNARKASAPAAPTSTSTPTVQSSSSITTVNRSVARQMRLELNAAIETIMEKHGMSHTIGGISYSDSNMTMKLELRVGNAEEAGKSLFEENAFSVGLKPTDYGRKFKSNGKSYKIVGIKPRSRKYPVIGITDSGKRFKFRASAVVNGFYNV